MLRDQGRPYLPVGAVFLERDMKTESKKNNMPKDSMVLRLHLFTFVVLLLVLLYVFGSFF